MNTPSKKTRKRQAPFQLPVDMDAWLDEHAKARKVSRSHIVRYALDQYRERLVGVKGGGPVKAPATNGVRAAIEARRLRDAA